MLKFIYVTKLQNMNCCLLNDSMSQFMRVVLSESKANIHPRSASVLSYFLRGNTARVKASSLVKIRKKLKKKKFKKQKIEKPCPIHYERIEILDSSNFKEELNILHNEGYEKEKKKHTKVPIVYLKDILSTQGRTTKSEFLEYFGLRAISGSSTTEPSKNVSNLGTFKVSQGVNIPFSSDMAIKMAARDSLISSESLKCHKSVRGERYNKYLNRHCSPVSVKVLRLDLTNVRKKIARKKRYNTKKRKEMMNNIKNLKVIIKTSEKQMVDVLLKRKNLM